MDELMISFKHFKNLSSTPVSILIGVLLVIFISLNLPQPALACPTATTHPITICVDPGHPSEVSAGRTVQNGLQEVVINWKVAKYLIQDLETIGYTVKCTKASMNERVTNKRRAEIANECKASLLIRLHCDTGRGSGCTLYYPNRQGKKNGKVGPPQSVIISSSVAAKAIHQGMQPKLKGVLRDNGVKGDTSTKIGKMQGALTGSIYSKVPAVTVEMVFLSNKADARFIGTEEGQQKTAKALAEGIAEYLPIAHR